MSTLAVSLDQWVAAAEHYPLLPSGVRVGIRIPDLAALIEAGEIPQHLIETALGVINDDVKPSVEMVKQQKEFTDVVVLKTVIEPKLSPDDVSKIPTEDKDMIVAWATRARDLDAEGEHIAGLTKSEKFRRFRGLGEFDTDVAGL